MLTITVIVLVGLGRCFMTILAPAEEARDAAFKWWRDTLTVVVVVAVVQSESDSFLLVTIPCDQTLATFRVTGLYYFRILIYGDSWIETYYEAGFSLLYS